MQTYNRAKNVSYWLIHMLETLGTYFLIITKKMPNERYRKVIDILDLQDIRPEQLAEEMNVTVDNLYNIHRRALVQLRLVMGRKEDWV